MKILINLLMLMNAARQKYVLKPKAHAATGVVKSKTKKRN